MQTGRLEKSPRSNQGRGRSSQTSTIQGSKKIKQKVQEVREDEVDDNPAEEDEVADNPAEEAEKVVDNPAEEATEDMLDDSRYVGQRIDWL